MAVTVYTVGHSTRTLDEFVELLRAHAIETLADVRTVPRSRRHPWFARGELAVSLPERGVAYVHLPELGGLRKPRADSPNTAWRNNSFRGYADYMTTPEFDAGIEHLVELARASRTAVMCAEAVPWRCHRSLIADALLVRGIRTEDIMSPARRQIHTLTPFAKVRGSTITYPAENPRSTQKRLPLKRSRRQPVEKSELRKRPPSCS